MKSSKEKNRLFVFKWIILLELIDTRLARVYEKSWPPKKKEYKREKEKNNIYIKKKRKRKKRGLAKLFRAKICLEVEKIFYRFQRKRVLCAKYSWDFLVRDESWV